MDTMHKFQQILEQYGGEAANKSIENLLNDPELKALSSYTEFIAKNWRDCFSPSMVSLGCQFVGGEPKDAEDLAVGISLINLSFRIWDDIIDETSFRTMRPTFVGKFGKSIALVYGGLVSAKAFTIINKANLKPVVEGKINELIWIYWATMAKAETRDLAVKTDGYIASQKLGKITEEAVNIQTALIIGAILGQGSTDDIKRLETYGNYLAIMFELLKDLKVSLNFTMELEETIKNNRLPLLMLMAKEESSEIKEELDTLSKKCSIAPEDLSHLTEAVLNSEAWMHFKGYFKEANEKCLDSLVGKQNSATQTLITIAKSQSDAFWRIIK